jgi:hypothetical protein
MGSKCAQLFNLGKALLNRPVSIDLFNARLHAAKIHVLPQQKLSPPFQTATLPSQSNNSTTLNFIASE